MPDARACADGALVALYQEAQQLYEAFRQPGTGQFSDAAEIHVSPDGGRILLGVAGHGADTSGSQGAVSSRRPAVDPPAWTPTVESGNDDCQWRRAWVYDLATDHVHAVEQGKFNVWEAAWCGDRALVAVVSPAPGEGSWYEAEVRIIELANGLSRPLFQPEYQLGGAAASPSGQCLAIVEALCSDRGVVAGDLLLIDTASGEVRRVNTRRVDVTHTEWRSERCLLLAGHRGFESVLGLCEITSGTYTEVWRSEEISGSGRYMSVSGFNETGDCVLIAESFTCGPAITVIRGGEHRTVKSFDLGNADLAQAVQSVRQIRWSAPDGLEIHGWLLTPTGQGPHPMTMIIHGGPVWHSRPSWLGRVGVPIVMQLRRGYAVFFPNSRGSSGRGQPFARHVLGDMGGADTYDCLSGVDYLIGQGLADPQRLAVMGVSYGGFMTAWLVTQDSRFAAAVAVAPITNLVTAHLISNIPHFVRLFLADTYTHPAGRYFQRSPIMHAHRARTPVLNICGGLDRCTPPEW